MRPRKPTTDPTPHAVGVGRGWLDLVDDLNIHLYRLNPPARVSCQLDASGLPALRVEGDARQAEVRRCVAALEAELARTCERCGDQGSVRAGLMLRILCDACCDPHV